MFEARFKLIVHTWLEGKLIHNILHFFDKEEAFLHIEMLEWFDSLKIEDAHGVCIHEQRNHKHPHHTHKHHSNTHHVHHHHHPHPLPDDNDDCYA